VSRPFTRCPARKRRPAWSSPPQGRGALGTRLVGYIRGLVTFIADGDHSMSVRDALRRLEAKAHTERTAVQTIKDRMNAPVTSRVPTVSPPAREAARPPSSPPTRFEHVKLSAGYSRADASSSRPATTASTSPTPRSCRRSRSQKRQSPRRRAEGRVVARTLARRPGGLTRVLGSRAFHGARPCPSWREI
jgi:hypothetical protein